ncbi:TonB-dependent receptor [Phenylobacterium sp.]|uniref:TonB-dependent receptor n=1 Tax=Phenylobacterium sp. TaxID=1871053 RepID=UPI002EDA17D5
MISTTTRLRALACGASTLILAGSLAAPAFAQAASEEVQEVVVTGFRASLASAIQVKKAETDIVDVINAEDIADFPDLNLAESLQRIPGVAIDRDGGEGRTITVRGLSSDFTRVRLNGLEALATTGGKDGSGGANRGRSFDFNVFASELFNRLTVRKSQSAEVEEGSLGATVDLRTAKPFDYGEGVVAIGGQYGYNDLSKKWDPRGTLLVSDTWFEGKLGALFSLAYAKRNTLEEGSSTGRWENPSVPTNSAGCFQTPGPCNVPVGTYSNVNSAWHPRIPRYGRLTYDWERTGATAAIQFKPTESTTFTLDGLFALLDGSRRENYLEVISFSRSGQGNPQTDVLNPQFDEKGHLVSATFNDVDVRTEDRYDKLETEFNQIALQVDHEFNDRFRGSLLIGRSTSIQSNPVQTTISFDRYDSDGYRYDYADSLKQPGFSYGFDVTNPASWAFGNTQALGDASLIRMRPNKTVNVLKNVRADLEFDVTPTFKLKGGLLYKDYEFRTQEQRRFVIGGITEGAVALPPGVTIAQLSKLITGFGKGLNLPDGTPTSWLSPDLEKVAEALGIDCNCINPFGDFRLSPNNQRGANRDVEERDFSVYLQADFETEVAGMPLRGNVGVRHARTDQEARGFVGANYVTVARSYKDTLPSVNLVLEPYDNILVRFAASKVMSRPQLPNLTPGGTINNNARTLNVGNPLLEPIRADTLDLSFEWYPEPETQFTLGFFYKDLKSYIQSSASTIPFSETGLPPSLLANNNTVDTIFTVTQQQNTDGGSLKGFEASIQRPFTFLPAPFDRFGGIVNFTYVKSDIEYITNAARNERVIQPLVGLSPKSFNVTLYYEYEKLKARVSGAYRDGYLSTVPGGNGNDVRGKFSTLNVDASASFDITDKLTVSIEGINLTDEFDDRWISSERKSSEEYVHTGRQFYMGFRYKF